MARATTRHVSASQLPGLDLKLKRIAQRVKQYELAKAMGVSTSRLSKIEREGLASTEITQRYLAALDTCGTLGAPQPVAEVA